MVKLATNRRSVLRKGKASLIGLASISSIATADHGNCSGSGGNHWRAGAELACAFSHHSKFDKIYNNVKEFQNSFVTLSHSDWNGNIRIRFGGVDRVSNDTVKALLDRYVVDGKGATELGDDKMYMLAGNWTLDDHNCWFYNYHIGRINSDRCFDQDAALKYWYHEVGHAHQLGHRNETGEELMDPEDWYGMGLNSGETSHWYDIYDTSQGDCDGPHDHPDSGQSDTSCAYHPPAPASPPDEHKPVEPPIVVDKQPL